MGKSNSDQAYEIAVNIAEALVKILKAAQGIHKFCKKKFKINVKPPAT